MGRKISTRKTAEQRRAEAEKLQATIAAQVDGQWCGSPACDGDDGDCYQCDVHDPRAEGERHGYALHRRRRDLVR